MKWFNSATSLHWWSGEPRRDWFLWTPLPELRCSPVSPLCCRADPQLVRGVRPLIYGLGYKPCSRIARGRNLKAETWESDRIMLSKLSEGHRLPLGGKAEDDVFLHKKANNFTLFLFIRHVRLGVEARGEVWSVSWGTGREKEEEKKLQESLCGLCVTLPLFLGPHLGRSLSPVGVGGVAGGTERGEWARGCGFQLKQD